MRYFAIIVALALAPLLIGIINQVKAFFAGRSGPGFLRLYYDLLKLLRKSTPRSRTTTWLFDLAPSIQLAVTLLAALLFPWTLEDSLFFDASVSTVLFFYLLGCGRFFLVLGALDTGSAFEGMGVSREIHFSALVEPALFIILGFMTLLSYRLSLCGILCGYNPDVWAHHSVPILLVAIAFFLILLSENCRVPFDDPETHLELTMIHEAMILDYAGPDLAFLHYGAALKLELLAAFLVSMILPEVPAGSSLRLLIVLGGVVLLAVIIGIVESVMARMRFLKTPQFLLSALMLAALATILLELI